MSELKRVSFKSIKRLIEAGFSREEAFKLATKHIEKTTIKEKNN